MSSRMVERERAGVTGNLRGTSNSEDIKATMCAVYPKAGPSSSSLLLSDGIEWGSWRREFNFQNTPNGMKGIRRNLRFFGKDLKADCTADLVLRMYLQSKYHHLMTFVILCDSEYPSQLSEHDLLPFQQLHLTFHDVSNHPIHFVKFFSQQIPAFSNRLSEATSSYQVLSVLITHTF